MAHPATSRPRPGDLRGTGALAESPLQILSVLEAAAAGLTDEPLRIRIRRDVPAIADAAASLQVLDAPASVRWQTVSRLRALHAPERSQVVGDPFSGVFQLSLVWRRTRRLVVVDDGLDTLELARRLAAPDAPLVRVRAPGGRAREALGRFAAARLRRWARSGRVVLFTAVPLPDSLRGRLQELGVEVRRNSFTWLREQVLPAPLTEHHVVVGSALVADGMIEHKPYMAWLRDIARAGSVRYLPHRRETAAALDEIAEIPGVVVDVPGAPVELRLAGLTERHRVTMLPSTAAILLTRILGPRGVPVEPQDVPDDWWTDAASTELRGHLRSVLTLAAAARGDEA